MKRFAPLALGVLFLACGGDAPDAEPEAGAAERPAAATPETAAPGAEGPVDPREVEYAPDLGVDLDAMERRESGLYVEVLEEGEGPRAGPGDSLRVHYTVWFPDGSKLDASHDHQPPEPLPMVLGETMLIEGWNEGVTGMREGERRRLVVPYDLAYGARGRPPQVPAYSTLVFELALERRAQGGGDDG